jgi:Alpha amylase, catalytic domain
VGESAWRWDERTGQYYYRVFLDHQPDLNWRNPRVQEAMLDTLRFWLARGVDGFRIDVLSLLVEDDRLRDNPSNPHYRPGVDFPFMRELSVERRPARDPRAGCSPPPGRQGASPTTSTATWPRFPTAAGRTGCWATTTPLGWPAGSAPPRPGWRPCY